MEKLKEDILKYALLNAVKFNGKANPGSIIGFLMKDDPTIKTKLKEVNPLITRIVEEVNTMTVDDQKLLLEEKFPESLEEKKAEKPKEDLKPLENVKNKVVMRFAPSPSGPLHIGHSYVLSLNYEYVKKYDGEMILRIEDTNPENIDPLAYTQIPEDANWICEGNITKIIIQSDRLEIYYKRAKELIEKDSAYICTCESEAFKKLLADSNPCPCRALSIEENLKRYQMMFDTYKQGDAVMRFKSDINHKNPAMRDFPLMRINESTHPRVGDKYKVWPLMNLSVAVDDMETKVTHTLRGKDHADNAIRQSMMHNIWGFETPNAISVGRINFEGFDLSTTQTKAKIKEGIYTGWDDIRIPFLMALRRRGYRPQALRKFALSIGVTKTDKSVHIDEFFKTINSFNKEIIEPISNRYFFVKNPVKIQVRNAPSLDIKLQLHPENPTRGNRILHSTTDFYITQKDYEKIPDGKIFRLMDCINVVKQGEEFVFDSVEYERYKEHGCCMIIHWLPVDEKQIIPVEVKLSDGDKRTGYAEKGILNLEKGDEVQFERFGFARFDHKTEHKHIFWYTHN